MKNRFSKLLSVLLSVVMLLSCFNVFVFAEDHTIEMVSSEIPYGVKTFSAKVSTTGTSAWVGAYTAEQYALIEASPTTQSLRKEYICWANVSQASDGVLKLPTNLTADDRFIQTDLDIREDLPIGDYVLVLYGDGGYSSQVDVTTFKVVENTLTEIYVSASGDDSYGEGTEDAPFKTVARAIGVLGDRDGTIYIMGTVALTDKAHTGTITYEPYDSNARISGGNVTLHGSTVLNVDVAAAIDVYTNGNYFELGGTKVVPNESGKITAPANKIHIGNNDGKPEKVVLKGQFVYASYGTIPGQEKVGNTEIVIDGAFVRQINPGASKAPATTPGNLIVTVNSGTLACANVGTNTGSSDGFMTVVFNSNTFSYPAYNLVSSSLYTSYQDYLTNKIAYAGGYTKIKNADTPNKLIPTFEEDVYKVEGTKTIHSVSSDGLTVYTTENGVVTIPGSNASTHLTKTITWDSEPFTIEDAPIPTLEPGIAFKGWKNCGNGVYTAITERAAYVSASGSDETGNGSAAAPFATIGKAIDAVGAANDANIYIMGAKYPFADKAHTGTITYIPYDDTATLAGGTLKINGPSVINMDGAATIAFYSNGHYLKIGGAVNSSIKHELHIGTLDATPETIELSGQYFSNVFCQVPGQYGGDAYVIINGALVYNLRPGPKTTGSAPATFGNVRVVVENDGELLFNNTYGTAGTTYNKDTDAWWEFVFNNNDYYVTPHVFSSVERTNFIDYLTSNANFKGGETTVINSDTNGNSLYPTSEQYVYDVKGTKVAWIQSKDYKTVYYSKDGKITIPMKGSNANALRINWADSLEAAKESFTVPASTDGVYDFAGEWLDNGDGTMTAVYDKKYYVKGGGTGDGKTVDTPAGSIMAAVATMNADGLTEGDFATIYIINHEDQPEDYISVYDWDTFAGYVYTEGNKKHTATIKVTSYDPNDPAWLIFSKNVLLESCTENVDETTGEVTYTIKQNNGMRLDLQGPTIFENINLLETRTSNYYFEIYLQGHNAEFRNVKFMKAAKAGMKVISGDKYGYHDFPLVEKDQKTSEKRNNMYLHSRQAANTANFLGTGGRVVVDDASKFYSISYGSYTNNTFSYATVSDDTTLVIESGTLPVLNLSTVSKNEKKDENGNITSTTYYYMTYEKNLNLVMKNGAKVSKLNSNSSEGYAPIVEGAIQVVLNEGSSIPALPEIYDSEGNKTPVYYITSETEGTLDVTEETGVYTVESDKIAYVQSDDLRTVYYGEDTIKILEAGTYTVKYADSIDAIKAAVTVPANENPYYAFDSWTDDGEKLTANFVLEYPTYYVSASGNDENTGLTSSAPLATIDKAIEIISAIESGEGVIMIMGSYPFSDIAHTGTIIYHEVDDESELTYTDNITLNGPSVFNIKLPELADKYIITNGHKLEIMDNGISAPEDLSVSSAATNIVMGAAEDENVVLTGGYIDTVAGRIRGIISGTANITVDGATVREILLGAPTDGTTTAPAAAALLSTASEDGADEDVGNEKWDTIVTDVNIRVDSGVLGYISDGWCKDTEAMGALNVIFNNNTAASFAEDLNKVTFNNGKWVLKSADTSGKEISVTDTYGKFSVTDGYCAYAYSTDGETAYYSVDGILTLPVGTYDIYWATEFTTNLLKNPALEDGYTFEGWVDNGDGTCEATIVPPVRFYVSKDGSDENAGSTADAPLATIEKAIEKLQTYDGTVIVLDEATYPEADTFSHANNVHITGNTASAILNYGENDLKLGGNTEISNITLNKTAEGGLPILTNGYKLTIGEGVGFAGVAADEKPVIMSGKLGDVHDKLVLESLDIQELIVSDNTELTKIIIDGSNVEKLSIRTNGETAKIKAYIESGSIASVEEISGTLYESVEIIANGGADAPTVSGEKSWVISSEDVADSRVDFTDVSGTFGVVTSADKTAVAVDGDGKIYVADEYTVGDETLVTNYTENEYEKFISYRRPLKHTYEKLTEDKAINVVYYGGSVTNGSVTNNWRKLSMDWFQEEYPDVDFTFTNAASGESGTFLGTYRVQKDVIAYKPDLMFLEYTINDKYYYGTGESARINSRRGCETIVREVKQALPDCDIVMVFVTDSGVRNTWMHNAMLGHEDVAIAYNIPSLNVGQALLEHIEAVTGTQRASWSTTGDIWLTYFRDIVHLTEEGNKPYFWVIREFLTNELMNTEYDGISPRHDELPAVISDHLNDGNRTVVSPTAEDATANGSKGFTYTATEYPNAANMNFLGRLTAYKSDPDAQLVYNFSGTELAIYTSLKGADGGVTSYSLDGGETWQTVTHKGHGPNLLITDIPPKTLEDGSTTTEHQIILKPVWDGVAADTTYIHYGIICTRDATIQTLQGAEHTYEDLENGNFTLPAGNYNVKYLADGTTLADITFIDAPDYWVDENGNTLESTTVLEKGKVYTPVYEDPAPASGPVLLNGVYAEVVNDTVTADVAAVVTFDANYIPEKENSLFLGWFYADDTAVNSGDALAAGTVISAKYVAVETNYYEEGGTAVNEDADFVTLGAQIRVNKETPALRFVSEFAKDIREAISVVDASFMPDETAGTAGYGHVAIYKENLADGEELTLETEGAQKIPAVYTFEEDDEAVKYTVAITDIGVEDYKTEYAVVPYLTYKDAQGVEHTVYGEGYSASYYTITNAAIASGHYAQDSDEYQYLVKVIEDADAYVPAE